MSIDISERASWVSALSALPEETLLSMTSELSDGWDIRPKSIPQSGLGLLKLNDSAFNTPFYLGEIPIASAWLEVTTSQGQRAEGAAQIMNDRIELAEALALCDAVLSARLTGWERVAAMVETGILQKEIINRQRKRLLAHTQVDFSLLDDVGEDNADS